MVYLQILPNFHIQKLKIGRLKAKQIKFSNVDQITSQKYLPKNTFLYDFLQKLFFFSSVFLFLDGPQPELGTQNLECS